MRLPPRPALNWKPDGTPVDGRVDDIYYSVEDGLAESRTVFLEPCGVPARWTGTKDFTIGELGFGTGLNFLAAWDLWRRHRSGPAWLHFVSFEGFPLDREDISQALQPWPELASLATRLVAQWPPRAKGIRRLCWPEEHISLTLHIGSIADTLRQSDLRADAWFLDGFSPAKNAEMWDPALWPLLVERSAERARIATFTVAGAVRRGLSDAGFKVEKAAGHGRKRQRLEGYLPPPGEVRQPAARPGTAVGPGTPGTASARPLTAANSDLTSGSIVPPLTPVPTQTSPVRLIRGSKVAVIGAGIAGACLASSLSRRGAAVTLFDKAAGPVSGASGNPAALVMPRLDAEDTAASRLLVDAYIAARQTYQNMPGIDPVTVYQQPRDAREASRYEKVLADPPLGLECLEALRGSGLLHKGACLVRPAELVPALLDGIPARWGSEVDIDQTARTVNQEPFDAIILASGLHIASMYPWLRLDGRLGQIEFYESQLAVAPSALASGAYALAVGGLRLWGATYEALTTDGIITSDAASQKNGEALQALNPFWSKEALAASSHSRAAVRATSADRLPVIGRVPDFARILETHAGLRHGKSVEAPLADVVGLFVAGGFGSRGFTWGPWAAQILTAQLFDDPMPVAGNVLELVTPARQILRDLKRKRL